MRRRAGEAARDPAGPETQKKAAYEPVSKVCENINGYTMRGLFGFRVWSLGRAGQGATAL